MSSVLGLILVFLFAFVVLILFLYAFAGVFAFPFFILGLFFRILFFPITLINTIFYPVGTLPYLCVVGFLFYLMIDMILHFLKHFTSFKNHG